MELVKLLIQCGADPTAEFGEKTPLEHAINFERADIIDYLESEWRVNMACFIDVKVWGCVYDVKLCIV